MSTQPDGKISYDDFIAAMDANIRHRHSKLSVSVDDALFRKLDECLKYSGESLYDSLKTADLDDSDRILKDDLKRKIWSTRFLMKYLLDRLRFTWR